MIPPITDAGVYWLDDALLDIVRYTDIDDGDGDANAMRISKHTHRII